MNIRFLTVSEVVWLHELAIQDHGGDGGIRDMGLLESAAAQPEATFDGKFLHETIWAKAAAYLFQVSQNQPFVDGDKRTAFMSCATFLELNGETINTHTDAVVALTESVAVGLLDKPAIATILRNLQGPA